MAPEEWQAQAHHLGRRGRGACAAVRSRSLGWIRSVGEGGPGGSSAPELSEDADAAVRACLEVASRHIHVDPSGLALEAKGWSRERWDKTCLSYRAVRPRLWWRGEAWGVDEDGWSMCDAAGFARASRSNRWPRVRIWMLAAAGQFQGRPTDGMRSVKRPHVARETRKT